MRGGQRARGADKRASGPTAFQLLAAPVDAPVRPSEIDVPEEFLEDLYVHPLIITPDYVGADRRISAVRPARERVGHGSTLRAAEVLAVVVVTLSVAVPLTLLASHAAVAGTSSHPPVAYLPSSPRTLGRATPGRAATSYRSRAARSAARAQLARQRAARRAAARQADASRHREARAARVRRQAAVRHEAAVRHQAAVRQQAAVRHEAAVRREAAIRRQELVKRARARKR